MKLEQNLTAVILAAAITGSALAQPLQCGSTGSFAHATRHDGTRTVRTGTGFLFYAAPLAVNTDGAPTSYHPDDPGGSAGLAINTICNGANARMPNGQVIDYSRCPELIAAFRQAKAAGWTNPAKPRMDFYAVASRNGRPCVIPSGEYAGYFVSTTSQVADASKDSCDQERYLNSLTLPFAIYPGHSNFTNRGVGKKDIVVIHNPANGRVEYGIIGDRGPRWGLGEVSVHFARYLRNLPANPRTRRETYAYVVPRANVLILSAATIEPPYTLEKIRAEGSRAFEQWGGMQRFDACARTLSR